jgi:hypothetical protein
MALAVGAVIGRRGLVLGVAAALAVGAYLANAVASQVPSLGAIRKLSPFYDYLGGDPLRTGLDLGTWPCWRLSPHPAQGRPLVPEPARHRRVTPDAVGPPSRVGWRGGAGEAPQRLGVANQRRLVQGSPV